MIVERLVRHGIYKGPVNGFYSMIGGAYRAPTRSTSWRRSAAIPHGSVFTYHTIMRHSWPIAALCIALGQHTRAGIEENLWGVRKGERMTSVQMIEKQVRMAQELGRDIATGEQAHRILKIGTWYDTVEETLFSLGLPPNRTDGQRGFLTYETDGRLPRAAEQGGPDARLLL
jgi:uncharacterized protein (DUF849 family)